MKTYTEIVARNALLQKCKDHSWAADEIQRNRAIIESLELYVEKLVVENKELAVELDGLRVSGFND